MDSKTRLIETLKGGEIDRPPVLCPGGMMNMITKDLQDISGIEYEEAHWNPDKMAGLAIAVVENDLFENYGIPFDMTAESEDMGAEVDLGTDIYEPHVSDYPIKSVEHYKILKPIDFSQGRCRVVIDAIKILKEKGDSKVPIVGNITGPFSTAGSVMDPVSFYKELIRKKEAAHEYMEFVTEQVARFALKQVEAGADVISISDPTATGELLGPKLFLEYAVPYINKVLDALGEEVVTIVHICGRMQAVLKEFDNVKADALSFDSYVPISKVKEVLPHRIVMGNVSTYSLEFMEAEKIKSLTKNTIKNGTDIVAPACGIGMKTPIENLKAMLEAVKEEA